MGRLAFQSHSEGEVQASFSVYLVLQSSRHSGHLGHLGLLLTVWELTVTALLSHPMDVSLRTGTG